MRSTRLLALATAILGMAALPSHACNVPVFRYALERWPADRYLLTLLHRGPLAADAAAVVEALEQTASDGFANVAVRRVDLADPKPSPYRDVPGGIPETELPCLVLQDPVEPGAAGVVWRGPPAADGIRPLLDSPARRDLRKRLLGGDSAVWLLLEGGDAKADDAVAARLAKESKRIAADLEIPEMDPSDPRTRVNESLTIAFSTLRLSRSDPAERFLLAQIFHLFPTLRETSDPVILPVFGRGRVLCKLPGDGLDDGTLDEVAVFLTGACSCEVKSMNPGHDLLMAADWDALIEERVVEEPPPPPPGHPSRLAEQAAKPSATPAAGPALRAAPAPAPDARPDAERSPLRRNLLAVGAAGLAALAAGTLWLMRRRPPS